MFGHFCGLDYVRVFFCVLHDGASFCPISRARCPERCTCSRTSGWPCVPPGGSSRQLGPPLAPCAAGASSRRTGRRRHASGSQHPERGRKRGLRGGVRAGDGTGVKSSTEPPRARRLPRVARELSHRPHTGPLGTGRPCVRGEHGGAAYTPGIRARERDPRRGHQRACARRRAAASLPRPSRA